MKYVKKFESVGTPKIEHVSFNPSGDGTTGVYIDGVIFKYGDEYHDDISSWLKGFLDGIKWSGVNIDYVRLSCDDPEWVEELCEMGGSPPDNISELEGKLKTY